VPSRGWNQTLDLRTSNQVLYQLCNPTGLDRKNSGTDKHSSLTCRSINDKRKKSFIALTVGLILQNLNPCYIRPHLPLNLCSKSTFIASSRCCCNIQTVLTVELHLFHMGPLKNVETLSITNYLSSPYNIQTVFTVEIHLFQMGTPKNVDQCLSQTLSPLHAT
jgi:hypothetical protein